MLRAVVIGIDEDADPRIPRLRYASADAKAIASLIADRIETRDRTVLLLTDEEATKRAVFVAVGEDLVRSTTSDDIVVIFFAGHGSPETEGSPDRASRYLVMHDTEYKNV